MYSRNVILKISVLALFLWLLSGCGGAPVAPAIAPSPTQSPAADFTGHWEDATSGLSLDLSQTGEQLLGSHIIVAQQGNKIDSLDKSIDGSVKGNTALVHFKSSFATNSGEAQITFINENTIYWKVTNPPQGEYYLPGEATLLKKAPASSNPSPAKSATIMGRVHLMAPPTPHMTVYAVDQATGLWAFTETSPTDAEAPFSLAVAPGSYLVYAFSDNGGGTAYSKDGTSLTIVTVVENQSVSGIEVGPPGGSDCGVMFGIPASPDGRFAAVGGPTPNCTPAADESQTDTIETTRIQFPANATSWQTPGDLAPNTVIHFVLSAQKGQILTVKLTTDPDSSSSPSAVIYIRGANNQVYTPESDLPTKWTGVLLASQDYFIDVRSLSQQNINYTLFVAIPAIGSTPYVPVSLEVCKTLQEMASQAISATFTLEASSPFSDPVTGETGQGCSLTAKGNGKDFSDPGEITAKLVSGFQGFTEQSAYQAGGPTGSATAVTRDMGLVLISANWAPAPDAQCPSNKPISECDLKPKQKLYTIKIQAAMK